MSAAFTNDAAWTLANKVRADLDRQSCPGAYMDLAMESINRHFEALASAPAVPDSSEAEIGEVPVSAAKCPITGRAFWGNISHPKLGMVATYGGPWDTFTIPVREADGELRSERYDQDAGHWIEGGELIGWFYEDQQACNEVSDSSATEPTDEEIETELQKLGMKWHGGSYWRIEDADVFPLVRSILAKWGSTPPAASGSAEPVGVMARYPNGVIEMELSVDDLDPDWAKRRGEPVVIQLYAGTPASTDGLMVNMSPPATSRDRWMYEQGRLAERRITPASVSAKDAEVCNWKPDEEGLWWTGCGGDPWLFEDGGPNENRVLFCFNCGKPARWPGHSGTTPTASKELAQELKSPRVPLQTAVDVSVRLLAELAQELIAAPLAPSTTAAAPAAGQVLTDEEISDAIECEFSGTGEWPNGDIEIARVVEKTVLAKLATAAAPTDAETIAYVTRDDDGTPTMLFFDIDEARQYTDGEEPEALILQGGAA